MEFGICLQGVIPVRSEPSHKSEMVTQVLFGELYRITGREGIWYKIQLVFDGYEGWIHHLQIHVIEEEEFVRLENAPVAITMDLLQLIEKQPGNEMLPIVLGSSLPGYHNGTLVIGSNTYLYDGALSPFSSPESVRSVSETEDFRKQLTENAMLYFNAPYLWGGKTPLGIDCSGFIQMVYKLQHIQLFRDSIQQAAQGEGIALLQEAMPGDLVFFDDAEGFIDHVGMLLNKNSIIHCSGKVRIDPIDHEGIYNPELKKYTHKLRLIRRLI